MQRTILIIPSVQVKHRQPQLLAIHHQPNLQLPQLLAIHQQPNLQLPQLLDIH